MKELLESVDFPPELRQKLGALKDVVSSSAYLYIKKLKEE